MRSILITIPRSSAAVGCAVVTFDFTDGSTFSIKFIVRNSTTDESIYTVTITNFTDNHKVSGMYQIINLNNNGYIPYNRFKKQVVSTGLFNSKSESARSESINHVIDSKLLDSRRMWDEIKSHPTRQLSAERLIKDICSIKDEM